MSFAYITEPGVKISKKGGKFVVSRDDAVILEIPSETLEGLVLMSTVQVSSQVMVELLKRNIPMTWLSPTGICYGRLESMEHTHVLRQEQQVLQRESPFALAMGKKTIATKIHNQMTILNRYNRTVKNPEVKAAVAKLGGLKKNLANTTERAKIMGFEGLAAKTYFAALGRLVKTEFAFTGRSKQPPTDPFNAMISFGYTLLMHEIYTTVSNNGLNPYFGFLHALRNHHPALVSDLMEEWRPVLVDAMVMALVQKGSIHVEHFEKAKRNDGIYLTKEGRTIFLQAYEKKLRAVNTYDKTEFSFRHSLDHHVKLYATALMKNNADLYRPVQIRG